MANKTVVTIDYEVGDNGIMEVASNGMLSEDENVQVMTVEGKADLLRMVRELDRVLRANDIVEIRFREGAE